MTCGKIPSCTSLLLDPRPLPKASKPCCWSCGIGDGGTGAPASANLRADDLRVTTTMNHKAVVRRHRATPSPPLSVLVCLVSNSLCKVRKVSPTSTRLGRSSAGSADSFHCQSRRTTRLCEMRVSCGLNNHACLGEKHGPHGPHEQTQGAGADRRRRNGRYVSSLQLARRSADV